MSHYLTLTPRDPLIARDGRPFGAGQGVRMHVLDWPYPSVLAGSLRTLLGKLEGGDFAEQTIKTLKEITVAGPFPQVNGELYFPAPRDLLVWEDEEEPSAEKKRQVMPLRPMPSRTDGAGCDLPGGLRPVVVERDVKPSPIPSFWSRQHLYTWLMDASGETFPAPPSSDTLADGCYLNGLAKDERFHVKIDPALGASEEGLLFMTTGLEMRTKGYWNKEKAIPQERLFEINLAARVEAPTRFAEQLEALNTLHPFGGERRLVHWQAKETHVWDCPSDIQNSLRSAERLRLVLATPAVFVQGWKPGWLNDRMEGEIPKTDVKVKLVSACVERWKPLSGWSLEAGQVGPKALRRLVPAGSVYFFEILPDSSKLQAEQVWLQPVSDKPQDCQDGFGLSLWGTW